jgi:hypothetical protein
MKCCLDSFECCGFLGMIGSGVIVHGSFFTWNQYKKKKKKHVKLVFMVVFCALNRLYVYKKLSYPTTSHT